MLCHTCRKPMPADENDAGWVGRCETWRVDEKVRSVTCWVLCPKCAAAQDREMAAEES